MFLGKKHETEVVLYSYEVEEEPGEITTTSDEHDPDASTTSGRHCAWCGDPPDENGSHGICAFHQAQMVEQAAKRRRKRGRA